MPIIYADTADGYVLSAQGTWSLARNAGTGTGVNDNQTASSDTVKAASVPARGGGTTYAVIRTFMYFDCRGVLVVPDSATLNIYGAYNNSADFYVVKADSGIDTLSTADFDEIVGWSGFGVDNENNVTKYSREITSWSIGGYNTIRLNSTALQDMPGNTLYVCLIESVHDLRNVQPSATYRNGMHFADSAGTITDPYVNYEVGTPSTFFGANF